ncbi:hypothetical protein AVEN_97162-1 [Araneus ventricosus]|uniref:Uncharacterized protein n=1 Tax=Araneus ventricosus TaxID=182803 RepID=A0A4Y2DCW7_ARAVE|nr:hypothetical protein AVEN_97162-1 [Araneus ventricosus]
MTDTSTDENKKSSMAMSQSPGDRSFSRNKSVQWADWELKDVMEFNEDANTQAVIDESSQTELDVRYLSWTETKNFSSYYVDALSPFEKKYYLCWYLKYQFPFLNGS